MMWKLYLLRCRDNTLYCGITTDLTARLEAHRTGRGAKYTRGRSPLELVYTEDCPDHSTALRREWEVKKLTRQQKEALIAAGSAHTSVGDDVGTSNRGIATPVCGLVRNDRFS